MKKTLKIINYLLIAVAVIGSYYFVFTRDKEVGLILKDASIIIIITMPYIIELVFKKKIKDSIKFMWIIFIFLAQFLGATVEVYNKIEYFDKFTHWLSGIATALLSLMLLKYLKMFDKKNKAFNIIWMLSVTLAIAASWEIFEYTANLLFGGDAQRVALTGVNDTMQDIIVALLGGIIASIIYGYETVKEKKGIVELFVSE